MAKVFNVSGACRPAKHYMVDLKPRLKKTGVMIEIGVKDVVIGDKLLIEAVV